MLRTRTRHVNLKILRRNQPIRTFSTTISRPLSNSLNTTKGLHTTTSHLHRHRHRTRTTNTKSQTRPRLIRTRTLTHPTTSRPLMRLRINTRTNRFLLTFNRHLLRNRINLTQSLINTHHSHRTLLRNHILTNTLNRLPLSNTRTITRLYFRQTQRPTAHRPNHHSTNRPNSYRRHRPTAPTNQIINLSSRTK